MRNYIIKNAIIVNEGKKLNGDVLIKNGRIEKIGTSIETPNGVIEINAEGMYLIPGAIDDQVHFREPGLTHKADIYTESKAAVAGGVTSFMEMPNTVPPVFTQTLLEDKYKIGAQNALANYSFFIGTSQDNWEEVLRTNEKKNEVCGVKIFMGSSTGNLLVDNPLVLEKIFEGSELLIATHCECESRVKARFANSVAFFGEEIAPEEHPVIRDAEACYLSSSYAIELANKYDARLHILHISTEKETHLFRNDIPLAQKKITAEVCVHHLHFCDRDYIKLGNLIKCNPAIKKESDRAALWEALLDDRFDVIATDHAPHTWEEKQNKYAQSPSGLPLVQHSLSMMMDYVDAGKIGIEKMVEKMCHNPAILYQIHNRGFLREGYAADIVLLGKSSEPVNKSNLLYKCGWSPLEGHQFKYQPQKVWVNGVMGYDGGLTENYNAQRLLFNRN